MNSTKPTTVFWVLGGLFLLWNAFGCATYLYSRLGTDELITAMRDLSPIWASAAYALAVWGGLLAAILMLLRKKLTAPLFVFSLIMAVISFIPTFTMSEITELSGSSYWVMPIVVILLGVFEIIFSRNKVADGTLT